MTQEQEDDFTRELAKMMVSSNAETRKVPDRKPVSLDVGIPLFRRQRAEAAMQQQDEDEAAGEVSEPKGMQFTLLTKKGNKPQVGRPPVFGSHLLGPHVDPITHCERTGPLDGDPAGFRDRHEHDSAARTEQGGTRTAEAARSELRGAGRRARQAR